MKCILSVTVLMGFVLAGCGSASNDSTTAKFSAATLAGNYIVGSASCTQGQFDPSHGKSFLSYNSVMADLKKDNLSVKVSIDANQFRTVAPSTFFGGSNKGCSITTVESISFPSDHAIARQLTSRLCSTTCSTADCKEEEKVLGSDRKTFDVNYIQSRLMLISNDSRGACLSKGVDYPAQIEYIKQ